MTFKTADDFLKIFQPRLSKKVAIFKLDLTRLSEKNERRFDKIGF